MKPMASVKKMHRMVFSCCDRGLGRGLQLMGGGDLSVFANCCLDEFPATKELDRAAASKTSFTTQSNVAKDRDGETKSGTAFAFAKRFFAFRAVEGFGPPQWQTETSSRPLQIPADRTWGVVGT